MPLEYNCKYNYFKTQEAKAKFEADQRALIIPQVKALSNEELLEEYTSLAGGDDYDGCHTDGGLIAWMEVRDELEARLKKEGFL